MGETDFLASETRLVSLLRRILHLDPPPPMPHEHSFFLSLTFADLGKAELQPALWTNCDLVELRVDLLHSLEPGER